MNFFLKPLVDNLLEIWNCVIITKDCGEAYYKSALIVSSSDLPATRKLYGFKSNNATKGKL